ncbi:MAG TPA: TlyA family RNA methyltransferase [Terriglobia bacterium]|nr:TlyA family RNA methyltransferase [Terriglobia bacterium]
MRLSSLNAPSAQKQRLDRVLMERGLAETRQKAQALILAGKVLVEGRRIEKAGTLVAAEAQIEVLEAKSRYVGRGGLKLQAALEEMGWDVSGWVVLDIGASTGGFVDCLLQRGAARVMAVDVGAGQLDWRLRKDPRVRLLERTNARYLRWEQIGESVDLITMDVSFISATAILPALRQFARAGTRLLVLVKPQFEAGKGQVGKRGIVRDPLVQRQAIERVRECAARLGFQPLRSFPSALPGAEGNQEFFLAAQFAPSPPAADTAVVHPT